MKGIRAAEVVSRPPTPNVLSKPRILSDTEKQALPDTQRTREGVAELSAMLRRQEKRSLPNASSTLKQEAQPRRTFVQKIGEVVARSAERSAQKRIYDRFTALKDKVAFGLIDPTNQAATLELLKRGAALYDENANSSAQTQDKDFFLAKTKQLNDQIITENIGAFTGLLMHDNSEISELAAETLGVFMRTTKLDTTQAESTIVQSYHHAHAHIDSVVEHISDPSQQQSIEGYVPLIGLAARYGDASTKRRAAQVLLILYNQKDLPYIGRIHSVIAQVAQHVKDGTQTGLGISGGTPSHTEGVSNPFNVVQTLANT